MDDPFGGFKGQRKSATSDAWAKAGTRVPVGSQSVFCASAGARESPQADVLLLPGFPCPSFLARNAAGGIARLLPAARVVTVDWSGVGENDAGQDGIGGVRYGVEYGVSAALAVADALELGVGVPLVMVGHGYLGTLVAAEVARLRGVAAAVFLAPVVGGGRDATQLPRELRKLRNPLVGPLLTGNPAHMADKVFASATPYGIDEGDMMVLRSPFMRSGGPGFAARATALNVDWKKAAVEAREAVVELACPENFATGEVDRWCPVGPLKKELDAIAAERDGATERIDWEYSGHHIFDVAPEDTAKLVAKVVKSVL